jgi:DNA-binding transcriptional MerR regulator/effector-binding domain-containing protein
VSTLVNIGEFARLSHLSVKALRHYHDVGLLVPVEISATGYRRYDVAQVGDAHLIRRLRDLDMPLPDIDMVLAAPDAAERDAALARHLRRMESDLARTRAIVSSLRELLERPIRPYDVTIRREQPTTALMRRDTVNATEIEMWSIAAFAELEMAVAATGLQVSGPTGSLFSAEFFEHGLGVVTAFVPLDPLEPLRSQTARHGLAVEVLPAGYYAVTTHAGPYHDLDRTYGALGSHVAEHCAASDGPIREHYVTSPADVDDSADFRTELLWPIEFAEGVSP